MIINWDYIYKQVHDQQNIDYLSMLLYSVFPTVQNYSPDAVILEINTLVYMEIYTKTHILYWDNVNTRSWIPKKEVNRSK